MPSSRGSSQPRDWTGISCVFCIGRQVLYHLGSPSWALNADKQLKMYCRTNRCIHRFGPLVVALLPLAIIFMEKGEFWHWVAQTQRPLGPSCNSACTWWNQQEPHPRDESRVHWSVQVQALNSKFVWCWEAAVVHCFLDFFLSLFGLLFNWYFERGVIPHSFPNFSAWDSLSWSWEMEEDGYPQEGHAELQQ